MHEIVAVILAGGSGTRLWPVSRELFPKQFLRLVTNNSLFQNTVLRVQSLVQSLIVVCHRDHYFHCCDQLAELKIVDKVHFILEPCSRNTAPAIALAATYAKERINAQAQLLVLPADHHFMRSDDRFVMAVKQAAYLAEQSYLVTFGVVPTAPKTGYGYIQAGNQLTQQSYQVRRFIEKPDHQQAVQLIEQGCYWNSGCFLFQATMYLNELQVCSPAIYSVAKQAYQTITDRTDYCLVEKTVFEPCPNDSIDYAVMEKTQKAALIALDLPWSDLGSWEAVAACCESDGQGNVIQGPIIANGTSDCFFQSDQQVIVALGLTNQLVVSTQDALLVADRSCAEDVKQVMQQVAQIDPELIRTHRRVNRPWGYYELITQGSHFKVKRLVVHSNGQLSLQLHHHRAEHWVVVQGEATVILGEQQFNLSANQSMYIPKKTVHRLMNLTADPLHVIEVQTGELLSENDIVRFDDIYAREAMACL